MPQEQALVPRHEVTSYSRKLTKADGVLDFTKSAEQLEREIRAFIEWPKSRTQLAGKDVIITKAHATALDRPGKKAGDTEAAPQTGLIIIQTARGQLCIERLKPAGKNEMSVAAFLAGNAL
jgi:methionyl-tRNA formyltransferase